MFGYFWVKTEQVIFIRLLQFFINLFKFIIKPPKGFGGFLVTVFPRMGHFPFFFFFASFLLHHAYLFHRLLVFTASLFYQLLVLRLFFLHLFLTREKKQANPDGSGPFSFVDLLNIWCRGIWLPIGGFMDRIYSA